MDFSPLEVGVHISDDEESKQKNGATVLNAGESSNPTEFRTAVNTFEGIY